MRVTPSIPPASAALKQLASQKFAAALHQKSHEEAEECREHLCLAYDQLTVHIGMESAVIGIRALLVDYIGPRSSVNDAP